MDTIIKIGELAPRFRLHNVKGEEHIMEDNLGWIVVVNFWSAVCDWCKRVDADLIPYLDPWKDSVRVIWIASNENESRELIQKTATERRLPTVLIDTGQSAADMYGALVTPHFFVVDGTGILRYQGAWDDITFRHRTATQTYVTEVVEALRRDQILKVTSTPAYGCTLVRYAG
jgi:peroxiredoxin